MVRGNYDVDLKMQRLDYSTNTWIDFLRSSKSFQFTEGFELFVEECPELPEINNLRINLKGIRTDENGYFEVFIPSGNY